MGFSWQTAPPSQVYEHMALNYAARVHGATLLLAESYAPQIERWMKEHAPWTDRTANARAALWAETFDFVDNIVIAFGHGVEYGVFLELAMGGRYQILAPALDRFAPLIWNDIQEMLR